MRDFFGLLVAIPCSLGQYLWHRLTHDPFDDFIAEHRQRLIDLAEGE